MDSDVPLNFEQVQGHICFSFVAVFLCVLGAVKSFSALKH